ncbi:MAG: hypothetical protein ACFCVK_26105 [Acidimicrobiales bacterium]
MRPEELLQAACELSYVVAREGAENDPPIEPPGPMRSFLYVADLPTRALTVAQQSIEEDPAFRRRVAAEADEAEVGRAGFLWLHRPIGWAAEFEDLTGGEPVVQTVPAIGEVEEYGRSGGPSDAVNDRAAGSLVGAGNPFTSGETVTNGDVSSEFAAGLAPAGRAEANAIEDELSSLRGLVDRLSSERKSVSSTVRRSEQDLEAARHQPSVFDTDIYTLQSELEAARDELRTAREERDNAVRQHSESLTRQLELEKELERSRELRAEIEREHADADAGMVEVRESLARAEAALTNAEGERDGLRGQLSTANAEIDELRAQVNKLSTESATKLRAVESDYSALKADADEFRLANDDLSGRLAATEASLESTESKLGSMTAQAGEAKALVESLTQEKIDLASRLADTEAMLDTTRTQLRAVRADAEAVAADLSNIKAHRDGLAVQVDDLHVSLTEALNDLAKVRSTSDADRAALKDVRAERDLLRVRVGSLEQIETGLEGKLNNLAAERDAFSSKIDQTKSELAELERQLVESRQTNEQTSSALDAVEQEKRSLVGERDTLRREAEALRSTLGDLETSSQGLDEQVKQLTNENAGLQSQLVEVERKRLETTESQGNALSELAHRLSIVETERNRMEEELEASESRLTEALDALESAKDALAAAERQQRQAAAAGFADPSTKLKAAPAVVEPAAAGAATSPIVTVVEPVADEAASVAGGAGVEGAKDEVIEADTGTGSVDVGDVEHAAVEATSADDELEGDGSEQPKGTKRHVWGLGPLLGRKVDDEDDQPPPPMAGDATVTSERDLDDVAAAVARAVRDLPLEDGGAEVADDEIDSISSDLAMVAGTHVAPADDDEDLDAISDLIAKTVTDFDPEAVGGPGLETGSGEHLDRSLVSDWNGDDVSRSPAADAVKAIGRSAPPSVFDEPTSVQPASASGGLLGAATGGRRRIEIPDDLIDDEVEYARHVVSSPDVVLLVDGDSVAKLGWPSLPVAQQRDALVSYLADLSSTSGAAPDVVFDGRIGEEESLPASRAVRIRLSTPPTEPTAALDELVDAYPEQWPIAVVTDDDELSRSAAERGAVVLNNGQLLDLFIAE